MTTLELLRKLQTALLESGTELGIEYNAEIIEDKHLRVNGLVFEEDAIWALYLRSLSGLGSEALAFQRVLRCMQDEVYMNED